MYYLKNLQGFLLCNLLPETLVMVLFFKALDERSGVRKAIAFDNCQDLRKVGVQRNNSRNSSNPPPKKKVGEDIGYILYINILYTDSTYIRYMLHCIPRIFWVENRKPTNKLTPVPLASHVGRYPILWPGPWQQQHRLIAHQDR